MAYKITNAELEVILQDWLVDWRKLVSMEEISIGPPVDALDEKFQAQKYLHDFNGESSMESDLESQHMLEEIQTYICMDFDTDNKSHLMMANQLHRLIKAVTDASDAAEQDMCISS